VKGILLFLFSVFIAAISQIMLKKSANKQYKKKMAEYLNPLVISAYGIFFVSSFLTMAAYQWIPLSIGPVLESTGYIFVSVLGYIFLKEKMGRKKMFGMVMILIGILIFYVGY